jgi:hypothetical protein
LSERLEHLVALFEQVESGVAYTSIGITQAVSGLERAVGLLDGSMPTLSDSATALRTLTERLGGVAFDLTSEMPNATASCQENSPELVDIVGTLDERFSHLDGVVTELAGVMETVVGSIPGMRRRPRASGGD